MKNFYNTLQHSKFIKFVDKPDWMTKLTDTQLRNIADDKLLIEQYRNEAIHYNNAVDDVKSNINTLMSIMKISANILYGTQSKEFRYCNSMDMPNMSRPFNFKTRVLDKITLLKSEDDKKAGAEKCKFDNEELINEAIAWLIIKGKKIGLDFSISDAVDYANDIAFGEECNRMEAEEEFIEFCGDDYCEDCSGWDKVSKRCDCGNRRVSWAIGYCHNFKQPEIYAEAY